MKTYADVDTLAERAFELRDRLGSAKAIDLRLITGEFCRRCGGGRETKIGWSRRGSTSLAVSVCWTCWNRLVEAHGPDGARDRLRKALWEGVSRGERDVLRNEVDIYPRGVPSDPVADELDEWARLRVAVLARPRDWPADRWGFGLEAWRVWLHGQIGSYASAAAYGAENAPCFEGWWTEARVRLWVERARDVVRRRALRRPRLLLIGGAA